MRSVLASTLLAPALLVAPVAVQAQSGPVATIQALDSALIATMKAGKAAGMKGRSAIVGPAIDRAYDLPLMTRLAVGAAWTGIAPADQTALVAAFRRMTIAQYASNFDNFSGQSFTVDPKVEARGADSLVRTTLNNPRGSSVAISYRLRGGKIIDVFYRNSISQLATRRSDFASSLQSGGAKALIAHLDQLTAKAGG